MSLGASVFDPLGEESGFNVVGALQSGTLSESRLLYGMLIHVALEMEHESRGGGKHCGRYQSCNDYQRELCAEAEFKLKHKKMKFLFDSTGMFYHTKKQGRCFGL